MTTFISQPFGHPRFTALVAVRVFLASAMIAGVTLNPFSSAHADDFVDTFDDPTLHPYFEMVSWANQNNTTITGGAFVAPITVGYNQNILCFPTKEIPNQPWYVEATMQWSGTTALNNYDALRFSLGDGVYAGENSGNPGGRFEISAKNQGWLVNSGGRFLNNTVRSQESTPALTIGYQDGADVYSGPSQGFYTIRVEQILSDITYGSTTTSGVSASTPGYVVRYDWSGGVIGNGGGAVQAVYTAGGQYDEGGNFISSTDTITLAAAGWEDSMTAGSTTTTRGFVLTEAYNQLNQMDDAANKQICFNAGFAAASAGSPFEYQVSRFATNFASIPEPSTMALLGVAGSLGMGLLRRKKHA
jgi:hypothetical protein